MRVRALVLAMSFCAACGAIEQTSHCDFRPKKNRCQERRTLPTSTTVWEGTCKAIPDSTYRSGACPREGLIGGCDVSEPANPTIDWYYSDSKASIMTSAQVMTECGSKPYLSP